MTSKEPDNKELAKKTEVALREEETLKFWQDNKIFEKSLEQTDKGRLPAGRQEFVFYDGPPFATGLPHYGHLLGSTAKDVIPRYKTMQGYYVRRRWGWDTHGLPVENIVEKKLGLKSKKDIEALGIEKFNEACRAQVLEFANDWKKYVEKLGRWVEFDNAYKTMDASYTESVWWALGELNKKGLLYEGRKVLMYCPHCETPLAKAEIAMDNSYKDVTEDAVTVKFPVKAGSASGGKVNLPENSYLLAWTTTPWTLPGNVGLAVSAEIEYVLVEKDGVNFVVAKELVKNVFGEGVSVVKTFFGKDLEGIEYEPLFEIPAVKATDKRSHYVMLADFVTTTDGTGIVHTAVMYGEGDYQLGLKHDLPMVPLLNSNGTFNNDAPDFVRGQYFKKADKMVIDDLEKRGLLFAKALNTHSYPHCYRCGTALIYNALSSWFINIQKVKARVIELNEKVNWFPDHLKHGRFLNIVENAPDWGISRNRFWASPLPIWKCDSCPKVDVISSVEELGGRVTKSGNKYYLMRHGHAKSNGTGAISDHVDDDNPLVEAGIAEAKESSKKLMDKKIDLIISSDFLRTKQSSEIVAKELGLDKSSIIFDPRIREMNTGSTAWKNWGDITVYLGEEAFTKKVVDGENYNDVRKRAYELMFELEEKYKGKNILILTHGIVPVVLEVGFAAGDLEIMSKREEKVFYPKTGEWVEFPFWPFPHKADFTLDLHRPYIDAIKLTCDCGGLMTRIPEVVDCWVESGSMPFAEYHYPFENKEEFEKRQPGDYVAEYIAQTRTWFYYMLVLSTALFDIEAFKNVVSTGTILTADGSKMSKSKGNYHDPITLMDKYGVDAMRYYLMTSVVMQGEDVNFKEEDVKEVHQRLVNMVTNVVLFYTTYAPTNSPKAKLSDISMSENVLDKWILARLAETHKEVTESLDKFDTVHAGRPIRPFVDDLSTWYLRRSRDRFKSDDASDREAVVTTMQFVLLELAKLVAPFMPFLAEQVYKAVGGPLESVHLENWTQFPGGLTAGEGEVKDMDANVEILANMQKTREIVSLALEARQKADIKVRQPLGMLKVKSQKFKLGSEYLELIKDEVNVKSVEFTDLDEQEVWLDTAITPELKLEGDMRDLVRQVQDKRKEMNLQPSDKINLTVPNDISELVKVWGAEMKKSVNASVIELGGELGITKT